MNPRHRDRVAFMRVNTGRFVRGMTATVAQAIGHAARREATPYARLPLVPPISKTTSMHPSGSTGCTVSVLSRVSQ
jgi:hypothetical protein